MSNKAQENAPSSRKNPVMTIAEIEKQIIRFRGIITPVAQYFGVSRETIYTRIRKSKKLQKAIVEAREVRNDYAESKLLGHIDSGNFQALKFYMQTQMRDRGYIIGLPNLVNQIGFETLAAMLRMVDPELNEQQIIELLIQADNEVKNK